MNFARGLIICMSAAAGAALLVLGAPVSTGPAAAQGGPPGSGPNDYWMPGWMRRHHWGRGHGDSTMRARMQRHWTFMHEGLPREYEMARSTVRSTMSTIAEGGQLYGENCASCHGRSGLGDGDAGKSLTPSPALLAFMIQRPISVDSYLLWSISEGGKEFSTDMPAFKDKLSHEEIWKIVAYMRAGFPSENGEKEGGDEKKR